MSNNWLAELLNPMEKLEQLSHIMPKMIGWRRWTIKEWTVTAITLVIHGSLERIWKLIKLKDMLPDIK